MILAAALPDVRAIGAMVFAALTAFELVSPPTAVIARQADDANDDLAVCRMERNIGTPAIASKDTVTFDPGSNPVIVAWSPDFVGDPPTGRGV